MNPLTIALIVATLAAVVFAIHRIFPSVTVKSAETAVKTEAAKVETAIKADMPDFEAEVVAAGQRFILWATDKSAELAKIAEANAAMTKKDALAAQTVAALNARGTAAPSA